MSSVGTVLFEDTFDLGPGAPYARTCTISTPALRRISACRSSPPTAGSSSGTPRSRKRTRLAAAGRAAGRAQDVATIEELYLTGLRLEQFHNPALEPYPYYEEALRRDPSDVRTNTALGILYLKRGMYREAEERLETAVARLTANYTRPKDGEALYYLGVARRRLGKNKEAADAFERAAWDPAWQGVSFRELAEMASTDGSFDRALEFADRALAAGANLKTRNLKVGPPQAARPDGRCGHRGRGGSRCRSPRRLVPQ